MVASVEVLLTRQENSLRKKIKHYKKLACDIQNYLEKNNWEWGKFQSRFNIEINGIYRDIMEFEKKCLAEDNEAAIVKLKKIFVKHLRKNFLRGDLVVWSFEKPYGYAGDHKVIDDIYLNNPKTAGFDRLYDNYFQMSAISIAVRNRKEDFKKIITAFVESRDGKPTRIMDLASGPCREIKELSESDFANNSNVIFDCYDQDPRALEYGKQLNAQHDGKINFFQENVVRIALKKDIESQMDTRYDLIYATGLFDYLDKRVATRLLQNLRKILNPDGIIAISDVRDKFSNPSIYFMEWVADWSLIYREDEEFRQIFIDAGFKEKSLTYHYEQQGIMQYIIAAKAPENNPT